MPTAMVLCAGLGTRLRPLTDELPKPLMPVGDRSALAHILVSLREAGLHRAVVNAHHLASAFSPHDLVEGVDVAFSHEPEILGTAGGIAQAAPLLGDGDVLVWNGDIHAPDLDVRALLGAHRALGSPMTFAVAPRPRGEGTVGLDEGGHIVRLRGRRFGDETLGGDFLGISVLSAELRRGLPKRGCLVGDLALPSLERGGSISSFAFEGAWRDIGHPAALLEANLDWLKQKERCSHRARSAHVESGVVLDEAIVSEGASVTGQGRLHRVLVLPGAKVEAPLSSAIVGRGVAVSLTGSNRRS